MKEIIAALANAPQHHVRISDDRAAQGVHVMINEQGFLSRLKWQRATLLAEGGKNLFFRSGKPLQGLGAESFPAHERSSSGDGRAVKDDGAVDKKRTNGIVGQGGTRDHQQVGPGQGVVLLVRP